MRLDTVALIEGHQQLIHQQAWKWAKAFGMDQEELFSFGRSELVRVAPKWNPARGKFTTFLTWVLHNSFQTYIQKNRREDFMDPAMLPEVSEHQHPSRTAFIGEVTELVEGWDAVEVMEVVEALMDEAVLNEKGMNRTEMKTLVATRLHDERGWRSPRIKDAFKELSQVIGQM